jgi:hypothetical protein
MRNQHLAKVIEQWTNPGKYDLKSYCLHINLDFDVALFLRLQLIDFSIDELDY